MHITIEALEDYLAHRYCGWGTDQNMFMKLVEEMGEVAEVLNKRAGRKASREDDLQEQLGVPVITLSTGSRGVFDEKFYGSMALLGQVLAEEEKAELAEVVDFLKNPRK